MSAMGDVKDPQPEEARADGVSKSDEEGVSLQIIISSLRLHMTFFLSSDDRMLSCLASAMYHYAPAS